MENTARTTSEWLKIAKEIVRTAALVLGPIMVFLALLAAVFVGLFALYGPI